MKKREKLVRFETVLMELFLAMVFAFSSMAGLAALFAVDIFSSITPVVLVMFLMLSGLFFSVLVLRQRLEMVNG